MDKIDLIKMLVPSVLTFIIGVLITPLFSNFFYKHRLWKRSSRSDKATNPKLTNEAFHAIHNAEDELHTPRVGGVIVWVSVLLVALLFFVIPMFSDISLHEELNFISRNQTWLPLFALLFGSLIGLADDLIQIFGENGQIDGIPRKFRILIVGLIGFLGAIWFYFKLGISEVFLPFFGHIDLGIIFILFFIIVILAAYSSSVIDGVDGLSAGVLVSAFASYAVIAGLNGQFDVATLCFVISGALLAFLWFNIPPARFYMGETGMMGLTITLAIIAFVTDQVLLLLVIGFPLVVTALSSTLQMISLRFFGKRIFKIAPLHNYFLSIGWSRPKVTMRYWVVSVMCGVLGIVIVLLG